MKGYDDVLSALAVIEEGLCVAAANNDTSLVKGAVYLLRCMAQDIEGR